MGEMADLFLESVWEDEFARQDFFGGVMDLEEAYDRGIVDEFGCVHTPRPQSITCRCCNTGGLHWEQRRGKWRLFDDDGLHNCPVNPLEERDEDN